MRLIRIPKRKATWTVKDREGKPQEGKIAFEDWATTAVESHTPFGKGIENIRKGRRLLDKLVDKALNGKCIKLEEVDWMAFKEAIEARQWHPLVAIATEGYYDAVLQAESVSFKG